MKKPQSNNGDDRSIVETLILNSFTVPSKSQILFHKFSQYLLKLNNKDTSASKGVVLESF